MDQGSGQFAFVKYWLNLIPDPLVVGKPLVVFYHYTILDLLMDQGSVLVVTRIQVEFKIQPEVVPIL